MLPKNKKLIILIYYVLGLQIAAAKADQPLYLEIIINGRNTTHIVEVIQKKNDWEIATQELIALGLKQGISERERILLSEI